MNIVAISGANIRHQPVGTSVRIAELMLDIVQREMPNVNRDVVALVDKIIEPCIGCGSCIASGECTVVDDFTRVYNKLKGADGVVFVVPHYAPIPAKLCALLERVESIAFLNRWNDKSWVSPLAGKPIALIGHGGAAGAEMQKFYNDVVLIPLKNALGYPVEAEVVRIADWPYIGVVAGPIIVREGDIFPIQDFDWEDIERKITPLAEALYRAITLS